MLKILYIGEPDLLKLYMPDSYPDLPFEMTILPENAAEEDILRAGKDADVILSDPMASVTRGAILAMPNLKLIHSVAVGYQGVDVAAASERNIPVCNCRAVNAHAVAEQVILLMLGLLRNVCAGDRHVREGRQIEIKYSCMKNQSLHELGDCTVGIIGFGAIGRITASLAQAFGARVLVNDVFTLSEEEQKELGVTWCERDNLLAESDMVSLNLPLFDSTYHIAGAAFFAKMKPGSYLINTARGELVDTMALLEAIRSGHLAGAGLDTIENEPVQKDNPLLLAEPEVEEKLLLSCHVGGITASSFRRAAAVISDNLHHLAASEELINRVHP